MVAGRDSAEAPVDGGPEIRDTLARAEAAWLAPLRERFQAMLDHGRLPHALLLLGRQGSGQLELGVWLAARLLCDRATGPACGACHGCRLFHAGTHPDFKYISVAPDSSVIRIEQIRELSGILALKSYRGGNKVVLIDPADAMNINSFNALLKTLEEPAGGTFLILTVSRIDRLPRTIISRTMRIRMPLPATADAVTWLERREGGRNWRGLLELANGAPFLALHYAEAGLEAMDQQMQEALDTMDKGRLDVVGTAEAWSGDNPEARLLWLESWLAGRLREAALPGDLVNNNRLPWLRAQGTHSMIVAGYRLLDALREARLLVGGALNKQLLFEGLLVSLVALQNGGAVAARELRD